MRLAAAGLAVGIAIIAAGVLGVRGPGACSNDPLAEVVSPGGTRKAVVFRRACGATTGFSTQVSVLPARAALPDAGGNVFVTDTDHGRAPGGVGGGPPVEVVWLGETELLVRHPRLARVFRSEPRLGAVRLRYDPR